jgi:protein-tyrosine-phosphatase
MAEAIARSEAWDVIEPMSAGIAPLGFVAKETIATLVENDFSVDGLESKALTTTLWDAAQVVVNMTGRPAETAFRGFPDLGKVEEWKVDDPYGEDRAAYRRICVEIEQRVGKLAERLRGGQE